MAKRPVRALYLQCNLAFHLGWLESSLYCITAGPPLFTRVVSQGAKLISKSDSVAFWSPYINNAVKVSETFQFLPAALPLSTATMIVVVAPVVLLLPSAELHSADTRAPRHKQNQISSAGSASLVSRFHPRHLECSLSAQKFLIPPRNRLYPIPEDLPKKNKLGIRLKFSQNVCGRLPVIQMSQKEHPMMPVPRFELGSAGLTSC